MEIDQETYHIDLKRYIAANDFGVVVNPGVVDGQTLGNVVLGVGQALAEEARYDPQTGQMLTADFDSYSVTRASWMPEVELIRTETPSPSNPLGAKGAGDASNPAVAPAVVNALINALQQFGVQHIDMPVTPEKIWALVQSSQPKTV